MAQKKKNVGTRNQNDSLFWNYFNRNVKENHIEGDYFSKGKSDMELLRQEKDVGRNLLITHIM